MRTAFSLLLVAAFLLSLPTAASCVTQRANFVTNAVPFTMQEGWYADDLAWWIYEGSSTSSINQSMWNMPWSWLAPKLSSALDGPTPAAQPVYVVVNYCQGPVFTAVPGQVNYSGLWQVCHVTWKPDFGRPITNADPASLANPKGLPDSSEADIVVTDIVVQYPIVATGQLDGPWLPELPGKYRMKQVMAPVNYAATKRIYLPIVEMYCKDHVTQRVRTIMTTIPGVGDAELAQMLGANLAPGLNNVPLSDTQRLWHMEDPKPMSQFPILEECPEGWGRNNINREFSPIAQVISLQRNIPIYAVINNPKFVEYLIGSGGLVVLGEDQRVSLLVPVFTQASYL